MEKKKQTFSILRVIKVVALFFIMGILIMLLLMGIEDKKVFPAQHEKEIKKWEEIVEGSCNVRSDLREEYRIKDPYKILLLPSKLELLERKKIEGWGSIEEIEKEIKTLEQELEEANKKVKWYCWGENYCSPSPPHISQNCIFDKAMLLSVKGQNPPSIFHYYDKIIKYIMESVMSMFLILLALILITLFEIHKLKNKNNTH